MIINNLIFIYCLFFILRPKKKINNEAAFSFIIFSGFVVYMSNYSFSQVPQVKIRRSVFNRSCQYKTAFATNIGTTVESQLRGERFGSPLIPVYCEEVLPGDSFKLSANYLLRWNQLLCPFMDNVYFDTFFFFVPNRLVWDNWQKFCGEQRNPGDSTDYIVPTISFAKNDLQADSLPSFFGLPYGGQLDSNVTHLQRINALPFRAYFEIWNEWFRDENLQQRIDYSRGDDIYADHHDYGCYCFPLSRGKRHDYFTSCLPWPQKGPSVTTPMMDYANVVSYSPEKAYYDQHGGTPYDPAIWQSHPFWRDSVTTNPVPVGRVATQGQLGTEAPASDNDYRLAGSQDTISGLGSLYYEPNGYLRADLSNATAVSINQLREAFAIQRLYEKDARGGTRYTEICQNHFGVINPDSRLQRPEFLGGSSERINVTQVPQTSASTVQSPQGNLAAYSVSGSSSGFQRSFTEHGYIIGLVNIRADLTYQQGIDRMWSRKTRFDFYWPSLANLGEQAVLSKEIYTDGTANDELVFGYQERWAEYRYKPSKITGILNSTYPANLDQWHLSQKFASRPVLNSDFIVDNPPLQRVVAMNDQPYFLLDCAFNCKAARPMPVYSVPGLIDHF